MIPSAQQHLVVESTSLQLDGCFDPDVLACYFISLTKCLILPVCVSDSRACLFCLPVKYRLTRRACPWWARVGGMPAVYNNKCAQGSPGVGCSCSFYCLRGAQKSVFERISALRSFLAFELASLWYCSKDCGWLLGLLWCPAGLLTASNIKLCGFAEGILDTSI